jgi:DNA polymerase I-like protein with 3'-5' exonuclease and polymerase domains
MANGNVIKLALIAVQDEIDEKQLPVRILLSIYDELQTECREDIADWWKGRLQKLMVNAAKLYLKKVPIEVDVKINDYWTK